MRIVVSNPDTLGDLVLRQPLFAQLQEAGHELMLIVRAPCADLVRYVAPGARVLVLPYSPYAPDLDEHWPAFEAVLEEAKGFAPDLYLVAPFQWTRFEQRLGERLAGVDRLAMTGCFYNRGPNCEPAPPPVVGERRVEVSIDQPEVEKNRVLASAILGSELTTRDPQLTADEKFIEKGRTMLRDMGLEPGGFWVACVGGVFNVAIKTWPLERWGKVFSAWGKEHARRFLFVGLPAERGLAEAVRSSMGEDAGIATIFEDSEKSLDTLMGLLALSRGYVGHDTGPMHLAAAMEKPVLAVFGGGTWPRFLPSVNPSCVLTVSVPCVGCNWVCPFEEPFCIRTVPSEEVLKAAREMEQGAIVDRQVRVLPAQKETIDGMVRHVLVMSRERHRIYEQLADHGKTMQEQQKALARLQDRSERAELEAAELRGAALARKNEPTVREMDSVNKATVGASKDGLRIVPPELVWTAEQATIYRPSWKRQGLYLGEEHAGIFEATKDLPGWQDPADSEKLYEMAYYNGAVILEIGVFGGRSAVVELKGALRSAQERSTAIPQYFGVDLDPAAIPRSRQTIARHGLQKHCVLYQGTLGQFHRDIPIVPTMVFVDGDHNYAGCLADLKLLRGFLATGTPVLCHDYQGIEGVRRAVDDAVKQGGYEIVGHFAGSILLQVASGQDRQPVGLKPQTFATIRDRLAARYETDFAKAFPSSGILNVRDETQAARSELTRGSDVEVTGGYGTWPFDAREVSPMPAILPGEKPWPKITLVTPSFNQGKYIEQTILSVLNQGYPNLEYIVVDGVSTDQTHSILDRYRDRISRVIIEKDKGQADAINKGMKLATGQILTWLNSDDMLCPGALHAMAMAFHTSGADIVAGVCIRHRDGAEAGRHVTSCVDGPLPLDELLDLENRWLQGQFFYQPEVMFTREIWDKAGATLDDNLYFSLDYELWLRLAHAGAKLHVIGRPIALYRVHEEQKTFDPQSFRNELIEVRQRFLNRMGESGPPASNGGDVAQATGGMRVVFFNDLGSVGGAGIAHQRLAAALAMAGCEVFPIAVLPDLCSDPPSIDQLFEAIERQQPDLVVVGNLHAASVPPAFVERVSNRFPTIQVLHDLAPLTGRCPYPGDCSKYLSGCDESCPTKDEYPVIPASQIKPDWQDKLHLLTSQNAPALAPVSRYVESFVRDRFASDPALQAPAIVPVRYGVPLDVFRPRDRATCRDILSLPRDRFIVLFSATNLNDKRKGLGHLLDAIDLLQIDNLLAVCIGYLDPEIGRKMDSSFRAVGYVNDPQTLAMLYSAADVFVGPSLIETFGQVFVESAACGTPSIGYPAGGITEAIADGSSGLLAIGNQAHSLADAINELHQTPNLRQKMGQWGRLWVENEWSLSSCAQRFISQLRASAWPRKPKTAIRIDLSSKQPEQMVYLRASPPPITREEALAAELDKAYGREQHAKNVAKVLQSRLNLLSSSRLLRAAWATHIMPRPGWLKQR